MNKKIFIMALSCCIFIVNALGNSVSASKLDRYHDMLHSSKYTMVYTEDSLINNKPARIFPNRITWVKDGANEYYSTRWYERNEYHHKGWLCVDGAYYQVNAVGKTGKEIRYFADGDKTGIESIPRDLGRSMLKHSNANQLIQLIYAGDNAMMKLRYVGEGTLTDGMTYEDYASYYDMMGIQQDAGTVIRCIFSGDELKQIKSVMPSLQGGGADMTNIVEFEKFTDVIDTDCFQLPVTQKVYDSGIKDYYIAEE